MQLNTFLLIAIWLTLIAGFAIVFKWMSRKTAIWQDVRDTLTLVKGWANIGTVQHEQTRQTLDSVCRATEKLDAKTDEVKSVAEEAKLAVVEIAKIVPPPTP